VPAIPEVVTLPLTDLSAPTTMLPLPDAEVVTAGTSCAPLNVTFVPDISAAAANPKTAATTIAADNLPEILATLFIFCSPLVRNLNCQPMPDPRSLAPLSMRGSTLCDLTEYLRCRRCLIGQSD
jgi:hypothetical protein